MGMLMADGTYAADKPIRWQEITPGAGYLQASCTVIQSNCEACAFHPDGTFACSTPGTACVPTQWKCMKLVAVGNGKGSSE